LRELIETLLAKAARYGVHKPLQRFRDDAARIALGRFQSYQVLELAAKGSTTETRQAVGVAADLLDPASLMELQEWGNRQASAAEIGGADGLSTENRHRNEST
jgi:hypothetical protein